MSRRFKQSKIEKSVNRYILFILGSQFVMCLTGAIGISIWSDHKWQDHYYLDEEPYGYALMGFLTYFTYFILLNTMLPISLIVTLEVLKIVQAYFMVNDENLYSVVRDKRCKVSSTSLNEELGMIQHVFSDKTGTLTKNLMEFKFCTLLEKRYGDNRSLIDKSFTRAATYTNKNVQFTFDSRELKHDFFNSQ